jgi:glycosyltransferase involved in cell wall biosynthesis
VMRIWIDGQCLQTVSRLRGIGRYVTELVRAIATSHPDVELSISFNAAMADEAIAARGLVSDWIEDRNIHVWQGVAEGGEAVLGCTPLRRLSEIAIAHHVACLKPDVALSASPFEGGDDLAVPYLWRLSHEVPTAAIFYDAIPHRFRERYLTARKRAEFYDGRLRGLGAVDVLLAISEFARREANDVFPGSNAVRIDAGFSPHLRKLALQPLAQVDIAELDINGPFVLYVGGFDWRKNIACVIAAFALLPDKLRRILKFVLVGDTVPELSAQLKQAWGERGLPESNLRFLGPVSDAMLAQLYRRTRLLVQPSLMEGFGLTAIEAMACGAPVAAANAGALPEVVGDPRALFNPHDPADLAEKLIAIAFDETLRGALIEKGLQQAGRFNWETTANAAIEAMSALPRNNLAHTPSDGHRAGPFTAQRAITRKSVGHLLIKRDLSARVLAAAEPLALCNRLLVDVTATCRVDHATGIQRVVNRISKALVSRTAANSSCEFKLVYSDSNEGFYAAGYNGSGKLTFAGKSLDRRIVCGGGDHVLMLDSSWEFHLGHCSVLRKARLRGCEVTSVVYDLVPMRKPAFCDPGMPIIFSQWLRSALSYSTGFVCISRAVADELISLLGAIQHPRPLRVGYWHLGADLSASLPASPTAVNPSAVRVGCPVPMYLMVGTVEPRKGYRVALTAFGKLWQEGFSGSLCIAGKRGWGTDQLIAEIKSHAEYGGRLRWYEAASDSELQALYSACDALISASYAEGFGLPIVEAARHGKAILASDIAVFREVAGGADSTTFFEVGSADALAAAVRSHGGSASNTAGGSDAHVSWMSWDESAEQLIDVVCANNWYKVYQPPARDHQFGVPLETIGETSMQRPLEEANRQHDIRLIDGPWADINSGTVNVTLKVTNFSDRLWSSVGDAQGRLGVMLSYHLLALDGTDLQYDNPRTRIPFVLAPGDDIYLAVAIDARMLKRGARFADFELVQEGVAWLGAPLRVALP